MHIKQFLQLTGCAPQRLPPLGSLLEQRLDLRNCVHQAVSVAVGTPGPLVLHQFLHIDTQQGVGQEGEQQLSFNSKLETLEILEAYTLQADGTRAPSLNCPTLGGCYPYRVYH